ncbi:MAG: cation transporter [Clostridia bacterium]|nr:cation transporter [Clostridia bacterium]
MSLKLKLRSAAKKLKNDWGFRRITAFTLSFALNVAYAVYNGVLGVVFSSVWFGSLAVYYIVLSAMRGGVSLGAMKFRKKELAEGKSFGKNKLHIHLASGIMLAVLSLALVFAVLQLVYDGKTFSHAGLLIYVAATYTFYKITMAIIHLVRANKENDYILRTISNIGLADALVSVLALQTAMFVSFGGGTDMRWANAATGGAVCLFTIALGAYMVVTAVLKLKNFKPENTLNEEVKENERR